MKGDSPKLICFSCKFGWGYLDTDIYKSQLKDIIPVTCSGTIDATHIMDAFKNGADGVLVLGCSDKACHFQTGNDQTRKRILMLRKILQEFGIDPLRLQFMFNVDPEGKQIPAVIEKTKQLLKNLGPLRPAL
jgi:F420-non-reducing hydrogenase iron-sulfur subunit